MSKPKKTIIEVKGIAIAVLSYKAEDFISLTDMLKQKDWESIYNLRINCGEFATIKSTAALNNYKISVKNWVCGMMNKPFAILNFSV